MTSCRSEIAYFQLNEMRHRSKSKILVNCFNCNLVSVSILLNASLFILCFILFKPNTNSYHERVEIGHEKSKTSDQNPKTVCASDFIKPFVNVLQNRSNYSGPCTWPRPKNKNVFLIETIKNFAIPKILCTVESAARHTKDFCVTLMIVDHDPPKEQLPILRQLVDLLPNVEIIHLDVDDMLVDTPFEGFFHTERFKESKISFNMPVHISDVGRANLLWRWGGVYVDLDVIVLKSLDRAEQYVARTPHGGIANGILKFSQHSPMLLRYLSNMWTDYRPEQYSRLFYVLLETVHNHCLRKNINIVQEDGYGTLTQGKVEQCDGVRIFGINSGLFEPFKTTVALQTIFNETHGEVFEKILLDKDPTVLHYAGNSKGHYRTKTDIREGNSLFARMFRKHCPFVTFKYPKV
ncbi:alpha-1,4-N-acetylglucosaminyltransferase-like [Convolutriloba macropyga]|uniref:alpha-1,4-N-acetylglucosaminyltransferase-like n=1 Tax=Convolutriloba macropyga TaxID=536237 RepID=UPI003F5236EE